jgi:hypothetical protein
MALCERLDRGADRVEIAQTKAIIETFNESCRIRHQGFVSHFREAILLDRGASVR